jgi:uncharacterized protein DUF4406
LIASRPSCAAAVTTSYRQRSWTRPEEREIALAGAQSQQSWGDFMSRDVKLVADKVQGIIFLPGWETSRGALLEATTGLLTDKSFKFMQWDGNDAVPLSRLTVACALHRATYLREVSI